MEKNKFIISVDGMHCRSCEILIEDKLSQVHGIDRVVVNYKKGSVEIHHSGRRPNMHEVERAIRESGYTIGYNDGIDEKKPFFSKNPEDYKDLGIAAFFLVGIYIILNNLGLTSIGIGSASNPSNLSVVFLVGLTAGISTCMALVGGLVLGISARHAEMHPEATPIQKFRPHLFFNLGRIGGYAALGGVLGALGSVFQLSGSTLGILTILVGVVMLMLGMKLTGIFPRMKNGGITLPKEISRFFGIKKHHKKEYSHRSSIITGALTFFLPCGFTQAMQLYAISTGSFTKGALIMGLFALGTAPGLLGVGGLTSVIKGIFAQRFFKFAGILVIFLALFNITNGYNLTGWQLGSDSNAGSSTAAISDPNVKIENGVQVVNMTESSSGYSPNKFTIKKGVPVKWVIDAKAPNSCAASIMISKLGIRKTLKAGQNIIEFTPTESGKLPFSCAMGMYTGTFNVVDENGVAPASTASTDTAAAAPASGGSYGGSGGGGCGGCGGGVQVKKDTTDTVAKVDGGIQVINTTYTASDYLQPNSFKVKAGTKVKLTIDVKDSGRGCGSTIMIPGLYNNATPLQAGKPIVMEFTPEKGSYDITCGMGMINYGTITAE